MFSQNIKNVVQVGFEPTPPKRLELESSALDHSATEPTSTKEERHLQDSNLRGQSPADFESASLTSRTRCLNTIVVSEVFIDPSEKINISRTTKTYSTYDSRVVPHHSTR